MLELRPVLEVLAASEVGLLLFIGSYNIIAWGREGLRWTSERLSDEGITGARIEGGKLHARGWRMMRDEEFDLQLNLLNGKVC